MTSAAGASYTYNVQGLRTSKTVGNKTTNFTLVNGKVYGDSSDDYYVWGLELITNGSVYYLYNAHGDVVQIVNSSGTVTKTYDYDAYGNELTRDLNDPNPFRYCGEYYDTETGFIYLRARYYNPTSGRFISKDTHWNVKNMIYGDKPDKDNPRPDVAAILQSTNLYAYCMNNPVNYIDYTGNIAIIDDLTLLMCAIIVLCAATVTINSTIPLINDISHSIPRLKGRHAFPYDYTISEPKVEVKTEAETITDVISIPERDNNIHIFPNSPFEFWPTGLVLKIHNPIGCGKNGGVIKWEIPGTKIAIFEWNEDYKIGSHYHVLMPEDNNQHDGTHYYPGMIIPEPWNTMYFGGI